MKLYPLSFFRLPFEEFSCNAAIQCTEVYEYAQSLGNTMFGLPHFQPYKFLYACRLADSGLPEEVGSMLVCFILHDKYAHLLVNSLSAAYFI